MQDEELRELTASEPLTLEEEYEMQRAYFLEFYRSNSITVGQWQQDEDKLTFIVCARPDSGCDTLESGPVKPQDPRVSALPMIGDVNILHGSPPHLRANNIEDEDEFYAEAEIMIAGTRQQKQLFNQIPNAIFQSMNIVAKDSRWKRSNLCLGMLQRLPTPTFSVGIQIRFRRLCLEVRFPFRRPPFWSEYRNLTHPVYASLRNSGFILQSV
jgi:hypothetical protein